MLGGKDGDVGREPRRARGEVEETRGLHTGIGEREVGRATRILHLRAPP